MKILQLGKFYPIFGGVEKVMWNLTLGFAERGVSCDMLCAYLKGVKVDPELEGLAEWVDKRLEIPMGPYGRMIAVPAIAKRAKTMLAPAMIGYLRKHASEYDIIHIHHPDPMAALALFLSGYKGRVILHWHSDILAQKLLLAFYWPLQKWLIRRAERIIGTTPVYLRSSKALKPHQDKVICVPIGIMPVIYDIKEASAIRNSVPGQKIIFALGRLVPYKDFATLIDAARYLPDDYVVLIGGTGPLKEELTRQINDNGLQEKVLLLGFLENWEVPSYFGACDLFVLSSDRKTEAFGIVLIEAMSCGKPIVATQIPGSGVSWVNVNGLSGYDVQPHDSKGMAEAIQKICSDPDTYMQFSAGALERFETAFTSREMIDKILKIYENKI